MVAEDERVEQRHRLQLHNLQVRGVEVQLPGDREAAVAEAMDGPVFHAHDDLEDSPLFQAQQRALARQARERRN